MVRALVHVLTLLAFLLIIITFILYGILYHNPRAFSTGINYVKERSRGYFA
jgi:hypothetical protein